MVSFPNPPSKVSLPWFPLRWSALPYELIVSPELPPIRVSRPKPPSMVWGSVSLERSISTPGAGVPVVETWGLRFSAVKSLVFVLLNRTISTKSVAVSAPSLSNSRTVSLPSCLNLKYWAKGFPPSYVLSVMSGRNALMSRTSPVAPVSKSLIVNVDSTPTRDGHSSLLR